MARGGATTVSTSRNAESQPRSRLTADWLAGCNIQSWATSVEIIAAKPPNHAGFLLHASETSIRPLYCPFIVCISVGLLLQGRSLSIGQLTARPRASCAPRQSSELPVHLALQCCCG